MFSFFHTKNFTKNYMLHIFFFFLITMEVLRFKIEKNIFVDSITSRACVTGTTTIDKSFFYGTFIYFNFKCCDYVTGTFVLDHSLLLY